MRFGLAGLILRERRLRRLLRIRKTGWRLRGLLLGGGQIGENAHDVAFLHDQQLLTIELDLVARPFAKQHAVANLEIDRNELAGLVAAARFMRSSLAFVIISGIGSRNERVLAALHISL